MAYLRSHLRLPSRRCRELEGPTWDWTADCLPHYGRNPDSAKKVSQCASEKAEADFTTSAAQGHVAVRLLFIFHFSLQFLSLSFLFFPSPFPFSPSSLSTRSHIVQAAFEKILSCQAWWRTPLIPDREPTTGQSTETTKDQLGEPMSLTGDYLQEYG